MNYPGERPPVPDTDPLFLMIDILDEHDAVVFSRMIRLSTAEVAKIRSTRLVDAGSIFEYVSSTESL